MIINKQGNKISKLMFQLALADRFLNDCRKECTFCASKECSKIDNFKSTYICPSCYEKYQRDIIALKNLKRSHNE